MTSVFRPTTTLADLADLRETEAVEIKLASGRDGQGERPKDFWPTDSAFANTGGGYVILGLRERQGHFTLEQGIAEPEKVRSQIFDQANNPQKVSCNLLMEADGESLQIDGKSVMCRRVPAASRRQRPVFINGNPLKGTDRRIDEASLSRLSRIGDRIGGGRAPKELMIGAISELCEGRYVTLRVLARLLDRSENHLRQAYLNPLVRRGDLTLAFPQSPNDPRQAYTVPDPTDVP